MKYLPLALLLLIAPAAHFIHGQDQFDDPNYEETEPSESLENAVAEIGMVQQGVDSWNGTYSQYAADIDMLVGFGEDVATLAAGDPNEAEVLVLVAQGDNHLLTAALHVDLASVDNGWATADLDSAWGHFDAGNYAAALESAEAAAAHLDDRQQKESLADQELDEAFNAYFEASMILNGG